MIPDTLSLFRSRAGYDALTAWYGAAFARLPVPCQSRFVPTRWGQTHVVVAGPPDAPPVLLLHGMGGNAMLWRPQFGALAPGYRVYAPDSIGEIGRSVPARPGWRGRGYGAWLADLLDELEIDRAHVVGISKGAALVCKLATVAPERIATSVLLSPMGLVPVHARFMVQFARRALSLGARGIPPDEFRRVVYGWLFPPELGQADPQFLADSADLFYIGVKHYRMSTADGRLLGAFPGADWQRLAVPTLLLVGEREIFYRPQAAVARARQVLSGLQAAKIVAGAGHALHVDHPGTVNACLLAFLQGR